MINTCSQTNTTATPKILTTITTTHKSRHCKVIGTTKPRHQGIRGSSASLLEGPLVLSADLLFLLRGEVVLDVEGLADLLRSLTLDHVSNSLAGQVQQPLDVEIVCSLTKKRVSETRKKKFILREYKYWHVLSNNMQ